MNNGLRYHRIRHTDLMFFLRLIDEFWVTNRRMSKYREFLKFYIFRFVGLFSDIYKDAYNIIIFETNDGRKVGFIHLTNLHSLRLIGSYKSSINKYLDLYSVDTPYRGKKFGSLIMRTVQERIYTDTRIFGMISLNNTKSLMSANKTGRKAYSKVFKFVGTEERITSAMVAGIEQTLENVSIKNYIAGVHERTLYEIYRNYTPPFVAKVENIEPADFLVSKIDRLITSMHNYVRNKIEKTLIVYWYHKAVMAVNIQIDQKSEECKIKIVGDSPNEKILICLVPRIIRRTYGDRKLQTICFFLFEHQKELLRYMETLDFPLVDKYAMVCNYEKFV